MTENVTNKEKQITQHSSYWWETE